MGINRAEKTSFQAKIKMAQGLPYPLWFFIGYWILKTGCISMLALFFATNSKEKTSVETEVVTKTNCL
jgi:hypothetical protein